jgi:periplasmic copper chaperone A
MFRRLFTVGVLAAAAVGFAAAPASAHVTVKSTDATQGGFGQITFRVPTESPTASTTKLVVELPADQRIASVSVKPIPGWTHKQTTKKLDTPLQTDDGEEITELVATVEWTAKSPADAIKPGEYGEFSISAGPLPEVESITFKAIQTYSDKSEVAWIEQATSGAEPEHPAPVLALLPAADAGHGAPAAPAAGAPATAAPAAAPAPEPGNGTATTALVIGILGLLAGVVGIGVAISSRRAGTVAEPVVAPVEASRD